VLNVGGVANLTLLVPGEPVRGFDTGPGNALLDLWYGRHGEGLYDAGGAWAASGRVDHALFATLLADPYFALRPPKSTGRDRFNAAWLDAALARHGGAYHPADVQATLTALTARAVAEALRREAPDIGELLVCGGGANNGTLLRALARDLRPCDVRTTAALGVAVEHVEALAFAWLAREALAGRTTSLPSVTGARGPRVLGAIYPR
jgi:anhydro-N-acetylmuramic acid kinase